MDYTTISNESFVRLIKSNPNIVKDTAFLNELKVRLELLDIFETRRNEDVERKRQRRAKRKAAKNAK